LGRADGDLGRALSLFAENVGAASCAPGFRGCPFINAAAEYADQLVLLRDGAMVGGCLGDPATVSRSLHRAARAVISSRT
jgi:hypothetical protein